MKNIVLFLTLIALLLIINSCQSRVVSRWTGTALKLLLPDDFEKPISFSSGRTNEKDLLASILEANVHPGPVIVDFVIEKVDNVYPMIPAGQSISELIEENA